MIGPEITGSLDGHLVTMACADEPPTDDCNSAGAVTDGQLTPCQNGSLTYQQDHDIGGEDGTLYNATIHFYGIMEPKNYQNNDKREGGNTHTDPTSGLPLPWYPADPGQSVPLSTYNTYEVRVFDNNGQEVGTYFVNSDTGEGHYTFAIDYEKTIPIVGGGFVRLKIFDSNCRQIKNCTAGGYPCSGKARSVDISGADPQPGAALMQPGLGKSPDHAGQWILIDVTGVTPM